ncbi:hypothetical protein PHYBOEH_004520 [Phytophthora boehmeriae]|uniref:Uncharacterized protein n=1 Tax=Phytophthora boehmeriae TaxID=109152 RepID=A0A8T1WLT5_9STRA|nr:hypothetical protein PHYBOEH_004520 [Phytophthora boehmeriae]
MLRKLFLSSSVPERNTSLKKPDESEVAGGDNGGAEFPEMVVRLDRFEERLKDTINKLSRHCQAICELVSSTRDLRVCALALNGLEKDEQQTEEMPDSRQLLADIATFRTNSIAPLQAILANIPQLKLRCDHRNSAKSIMIRYQHKVEEIQSMSCYESPRLRRNRVKHQVAATRFKDLNDEVRADVDAVLANDLPEVAAQAIEKLLVQHQLLTANWMQAEVVSLQNRLGVQQAVKEHELREQQQASYIAHEQHTENADDLCDNNNNNADEKHIEDPAVNVRLSSYSSATASPNKFQAKEAIRIMPQHVLNQEQSICPRKKHVSGTRTWNLHRHIKDSMASGLDLTDCIQLPEGCQHDEWVAVHVIDFFNEISLLFGTISEFCTHSSCPQMSAGPCYTYLWADGVQQVTPISLPASEYVSRLLEWVEQQLDDSQLFPEVYSESTGDDSNPKFMATARNILKRLFRVYAHMYHNHLQNYVALHAETHLNFCFKRFVLFVRHFELIEQKELNALRKLIQTLLAN